jgi:hypothetical protein
MRALSQKRTDGKSASLNESRQRLAPASILLAAGLNLVFGSASALLVSTVQAPILMLLASVMALAAVGVVTLRLRSSAQPLDAPVGAAGAVLIFSSLRIAFAPELTHEISERQIDGVGNQRATPQLRALGTRIDHRTSEPQTESRWSRCTPQQMITAGPPHAWRSRARTRPEYPLGKQKTLAPARRRSCNEAAALGAMRSKPREQASACASPRRREQGRRTWDKYARR